MLLKNKVLTLPNFLSFFRIIITPVIIYFLLHHQYVVVTFLFFLGAISDFFDGFFARYFKQETIVGSYVDPLADKIFLVSLLFFFTYYQNSVFYAVPKWFFYLLFFRECVQIFVLFLYGHIRHFNRIKPSLFSKINTGILMALLFFLCIAPLNYVPSTIYYAVLPLLTGLSTFLTIISFLHYCFLFCIKSYLK